MLPRRKEYNQNRPASRLPTPATDSSRLQAKESVEIICGVSAYFFSRQTAQFADMLCRFVDVSGLIALAAMRNGTSVARIGFDENAFEWNLSRRVANQLRFGKADVACERNHETHVQRPFCVTPGASEAMQ